MSDDLPELTFDQCVRECLDEIISHESDGIAKITTGFVLGVEVMGSDGQYRFRYSTMEMQPSWRTKGLLDELRDTLVQYQQASEFLRLADDDGDEDA